MQFPELVSKVSLHRDWAYAAPYPPLGFIPFYEGELGNGDTFGLYWPIGREESAPIVVETWHDEWRVQPSFSSVEKFLYAFSSADEGYVEMLPLSDDPASPRACFDTAKRNIQEQNFTAAIRYLESALAVLPEYTDALSLLHAQYVRAGRIDDAMIVARQAIISPPSFGARPHKVLQWLRSQKLQPLWHDDPILRAKDQLVLKYGGAKENPDYPIILSAIDEYIVSADFVSATTLMQTYAELMSSETVSFQDRYSFNRMEFIARQIEVSGSLPDGSRNPELLWPNDVVS